MNSFVSEDGSLPTLKEGDDTLEPGTYVFNVFANRPHYNQPSLVTLKDGKQEMHSRQLNFLGTPVEIKAGQQAKITVEQHNKPYNVAEGEFQTGDNKPSTCMMAIFPRGYPAMDDLDLKEYTFKFQSGDKLVLYSDGVPEANNLDGHQFGNTRFIECLEKNGDLSASMLIRQIVETTGSWMRGTAPFDDLTLLVVEAK